MIIALFYFTWLNLLLQTRDDNLNVNGKRSIQMIGYHSQMIGFQSWPIIQCFL